MCQSRKYSLDHQPVILAGILQEFSSPPRLPIAPLNARTVSSSSFFPAEVSLAVASPLLSLDPISCRPSCDTVPPSSPSTLLAMPCRLRCSFNKLNPSPPLSASRCLCAFALAALMLVRVYTNSRQAMVKAAAGATMVRELMRRGNGCFGEGGGLGLVGTEDSVVPAGPRGCERRAPMLQFVVVVMMMMKWLGKCPPKVDASSSEPSRGEVIANGLNCKRDDFAATAIPGTVCSEYWFGIVDSAFDNVSCLRRRRLGSSSPTHWSNTERCSPQRASLLILYVTSDTKVSAMLKNHADIPVRLNTV